MNNYKKIASNYLLELMGKEWLDKNKNNICTFCCDNKSTVKITFCLISMLPTEQEVIQSIDFNFQPKGSISFVINKKTMEIIVDKNLLQI